VVGWCATLKAMNGPRRKFFTSSQLARCVAWVLALAVVLTQMPLVHWHQHGKTETSHRVDFALSNFYEHADHSLIGEESGDSSSDSDSLAHAHTVLPPSCLTAGEICLPIKRVVASTLRPAKRVLAPPNFQFVPPYRPPIA
jgi:hypothetical protein